MCRITLQIRLCRNSRNCHPETIHPPLPFPPPHLSTTRAIYTTTTTTTILTTTITTPHLKKDGQTPPTIGIRLHHTLHNPHNYIIHISLRNLLLWSTIPLAIQINPSYIYISMFISLFLSAFLSSLICIHSWLALQRQPVFTSALFTMPPVRSYSH